MTTRTTSSTGLRNIQDNLGRLIVAWYRQQYGRKNARVPNHGTWKGHCLCGAGREAAGSSTRDPRLPLIACFSSTARWPRNRNSAKIRPRTGCEYWPEVRH